MRGAFHHGRCVGNHPSPCRLIRRASQSKETQHRLRNDAARQNDAQLGDQRAHDVWEQVQLQDVHAAAAETSGGKHILPRCFALIDRTRDVSDKGRKSNAGGRHELPLTAAQPHDDEERHQGARQRAHQIDKGKKHAGGKTPHGKRRQADAGADEKGDEGEMTGGYLLLIISAAVLAVIIAVIAAVLIKKRGGKGKGPKGPKGPNGPEDLGGSGSLHSSEIAAKAAQAAEEHRRASTDTMVLEPDAEPVSRNTRMFHKGDFEQETAKWEDQEDRWPDDDRW